MTQPGILFFIVGPSGAGKDTLIDGARRALARNPRFVFARRAITRGAGAAGEDHDAVDPEDFARREADGAFLITWAAHGLRYGLSATLLAELRAGRHVVANGSRAHVAELATKVPRLMVVEVTAPPAVLATRLQARGREDGASIAARLARQVPEYPAGISLLSISNDSTVESGVERLTAALDAAGSRFRLRRMPVDTGRRHLAFLPEDSTVVAAASYLGPRRIDVSADGRSLSAEVALVARGSLLASDELGLSAAAFDALGQGEAAEVTIRRTTLPNSRDALRRKIRGAELTEADYDRVIGDIVAGRYSDGEVAGFLVAANRSLSDAEVLALARVRARFSQRIVWDEPIVVDKHSMGGIPGSRITMIVVPLVAAHGLAMPKTSSRAITSAAGTADAMETLARVDLSMADMKRVVAQCRGCIAWNGGLSHSALDDVMNAITRPLGLDANRWSVASILSKKLAAGSTHVVVDIPYGPAARVPAAAAAEELGRLFEGVGSQLGLTVAAIPTDGGHPVGRGIGPALEVRDVLQVLDNDPAAPADLRAKALTFTARILSWDHAIPSTAAAQRRAEDVLSSGAGRAALEAMIDAQGRQPNPPGPGLLTHLERAPAAGRVAAVDGYNIAGIARRAGAPLDKGAGVDLLVQVGDTVRAGDPLFRIHANAAGDLNAAVQFHAGAPVFRVE